MRKPQAFLGSGDVESLMTVIIPATQEHQGFHAVEVTLVWRCPSCGGPRGEPYETISYDGSRRLGCHGWDNPCGHVDYYRDVRKEAGLRA